VGGAMAFEFLKRKPATRNIQDLEELFNLFHESVYQSAYFIVRDRMLAEDVVQDTFLKAYDKIDQLRDTSRIESWLVRIAMNKARDQLRRRKCRVTIPNPENDARFTDALDELPEARLLVQEEHLVLNAAIDKLAFKYQEVVFF
jgi:RNA polymerase sigma-70 factor (ECF subfamily)